MPSPSQIALDLYAALERGSSATELGHHFTDDAATREYPNLLKPQGDVVSIERMLDAAQAGAALLSHQRYVVHETFEHDDTAVLRLTWTGTVAQDAGPFIAGQVLTAHIAQFIGTRDGKVAAIATYDCYEPF